MEIWKDVVGYEGLYQVSNIGRIKSMRRGIIYKDVEICRNGFKSTFIHPVRERIMKQHSYGTGYKQIMLSNKGTKSSPAVHRLVISAFVGPLPDGCQVNHKDGNKSNNRVENLEYVTARENMMHAKMTGLWDLRGERNSNTELSKDDIVNIRRDYSPRKISSRFLARKYNVNKSTILNIIHRRTWGHI